MAAGAKWAVEGEGERRDGRAVQSEIGISNLLPATHRK